MAGSTSSPPVARPRTLKFISTRASSDSMMKTFPFLVLAGFLAASARGAEELRLGLIGLDTSHVIAFTKLINDPKAKDHVLGGKVVAAFAGGSRDIESSWSRVE